MIPNIWPYDFYINMRGIMQARQKPLTVVAPVESNPSSSTDTFQKPPAKGPVKLVDAKKNDQLIDLLQKEANAL